MPATYHIRHSDIKISKMHEIYTQSKKNINFMSSITVRASRKSSCKQGRIMCPVSHQLFGPQNMSWNWIVPIYTSTCLRCFEAKATDRAGQTDALSYPLKPQSPYYISKVKRKNNHTLICTNSQSVHTTLCGTGNLFGFHLPVLLSFTSHCS